MDPETIHSRGGRARAASLTPEQRKAIAQRAAAARWGKPEPEGLPAPMRKLVTLHLPASLDFSIKLSGLIKKHFPKAQAVGTGPLMIYTIPKKEGEE